MLKILTKESGIRVTPLTRKVGRYGEVNRNLRLFEKAGIIKDERTVYRNRKIRTIYFLKETRRAQLLLKILALLSDDDDENESSKTHKR